MVDLNNTAKIDVKISCGVWFSSQPVVCLQRWNVCTIGYIKVRCASHYQIRSFFNIVQKAFDPPPFVLNIMLQIFLKDFLKSL